MKCPHCLVEFHEEVQQIGKLEDGDGRWFIEARICPACSKMILHLKGVLFKKNPTLLEQVEYMVYPAGISRPVPPEVPLEFADDFKEAALVLEMSPKASAALGRRCLQRLLREKAGVRKSELSKEIGEVIGNKSLPSHIAEAIDAVRNIGNFAAHPIKATASGEIFDVEPGEAEWTLGVLESLFDFYFVQPEKLRQKKAALDAKLAAAGKPPTK